MGTIKAELCKIINILGNTYMGQLEEVKSQTIKRTQMRNSKTSPINQQKDWEEMGAYISN
jgi:hypothetical protein